MALSKKSSIFAPLKNARFIQEIITSTMADLENNNQSIISLSQAVEVIKTAILQGQFEAVKDVNRIQLAVYFAIGKYFSK